MTLLYWYLVLITAFALSVNIVTLLGGHEEYFAVSRSRIICNIVGHLIFLIWVIAVWP